MWETVTVEMVSGYCVPSDASDKLYCVPSDVSDKLRIPSIVSGILRY